MKKIILISGKSGSGKDTFAKFLKDELESRNERVLVIHFADMVKEYAKLYYKWNGEKDISGRQLLQQMGTNEVRSVFKNYWADLVAQFIKATEDDWDYALIPDLRFLNELKRVKKFNKGKCVSVGIRRYTDDGEIWENPLLTEEQRNHPSEVDLDDYCLDWYVDNVGAFEGMKVSAIEFLEKIGEYPKE